MANHEEERKSEDHVNRGNADIHLKAEYQFAKNIYALAYQLSLLLCQAYFYILFSFRHIITKPYSWKGDKAKVDSIEEVPLLGLDEHESPWSGFHLNFVWFLFFGLLQIG
jgi:hypothetical protein